MQTWASGYRTADIRQAAVAHARLASHRFHAFLRLQPDLHTLLAAIGSLGLLQQLLPESFADTNTWTDIFSDRKLYRVAAVEPVSSA